MDLITFLAELAYGGELKTTIRLGKKGISSEPSLCNRCKQCGDCTIQDGFPVVKCPEYKPTFLLMRSENTYVREKEDDDMKIFQNENKFEEYVSSMKEIHGEFAYVFQKRGSFALLSIEGEPNAMFMSLNISDKDKEYFLKNIGEDEK